MYSFFYQIKEGSSTISEKMNLIKLFKKFILGLKNKKQASIALAFAEKVQYEKENSFYTFFHDLIVF